MRKRISTLATATAVMTVAATAGLYGQGPDRSGPPELGAPPTLSLPAIQQFELSNGLPVMLVEKLTVPLVQLNLVVRVGAAHDPSDRIGLARMTADMMDEGAAGMDALALADAIDFLGASISVRAGTHTTSVGLFTPVSKLDDALLLMADIALRPDFPSADLDRKKTSRLTTLLQAHDEGGAIARVLFAKALFGEEHPYGRPSLSTEASIKAMTTDGMRLFHSTYFRPNNSVVIVVGAVNAAELMPKLEEAFGSWEARPVPEARWPEANQVGEREILLVDQPGAAQSEIFIGRIGVARATDDYYALQVMNTMLGGAFGSRLNQNLREEHGYTYGARSSFQFSLLKGAFRASSAVQTDATAPALHEFFKEFDGILETLSEDEVVGAKNYVAYQYPGRFQSVRGIAASIDDLWIYDLPIDYLNGYVDQTLAVSRGDVQRVAREQIVPDRMVIVVVGDREKIEDEIRALGLGPIRNLSIEDVLGRKPELQ